MDELTEEGDVGKVSPYNRIKTRINDRIDHFKTDVAKVSQCLLVNLTAVNITQNNLEPFELIINCFKLTVSSRDFYTLNCPNI